MASLTKTSILQRTLSSLASSPFIAKFVGLAVLIECCFVLSRGVSMRTTDGMTQLFGLAYVLWFWLTTGWVLGHATTFWSRANFDGWRRYLVGSVFVILFSVVVLVYAISWGLFFKVGRLANLEAIRFLVFNFKFLWDYVSQAEPTHLVAGGLVLLGTLLSVPVFFRFASNSQWKQEPSPACKLIAWSVCSVGLMFLWSWIPVEESVLRRAVRRRALQMELHPTFSLLVSYWESQAHVKITPSLDTAALIPLSQGGQPTIDGDRFDQRSVILIAVESLRHDTIFQTHQGKEVLPHINGLAKNGLNLTCAYAQSTHSDYADICLVSSLYPLRTIRHHYYSEGDPWPQRRIYDSLKPLGYQTAIISSQNESWGGMANFLRSPNLDLFYHPETATDDVKFQETSKKDPGFARERSMGTLKAGKFPDSHTTTQAIRWIKQQSKEQRPYFLSMNLQSSHFPYLLSEDTPRPFQPCELDAQTSFVSYPKDQVPVVKNAYFNAIHECDRQIGRILDALEELGKLQNTLVIVTGENGEAFHECGGSVGHAREPVEPAIHVACVLSCPDLISARTEDYPFEHIDLTPTILGLLGVSTHPNFQGIDVLSDQRPKPEHRLTFCHVNSSLANCDSVILAGRWKLTLDLLTTRLTLHDVVQDPNQEVDLMDVEHSLAEELTKVLKRWRQDQMAYYHFPQYYLNYYPPDPPSWNGKEKRILDANETIVVTTSR